MNWTNAVRTRLRSRTKTVVVAEPEPTPGQTVDVTASDIRFNGEAEVLNPDLVIATLTEGGRFEKNKKSKKIKKIENKGKN